jgi:hypothetical protein
VGIGAQFVPMRMPIVCYKRRPQNITNIVLIKNSSILMISGAPERYAVPASLVTLVLV